MAGGMRVAVTREGAVGALKLLMIVLAAVIFWESASALNGELRARGFTTAPPFLRGASKLLIGTETQAPFQARVKSFWAGNHHLLGILAIMAAATLLVMRYLILGRVLDFLYLDSPAYDKRIYSGFVANIFLMLTHAGMIYGTVLVARDNHASLAPLTLLALFGFNLLWSGGMYFAARPAEKQALRGLKFVAMTSGAALIVLFWATWALEAAPVKDQALRGSKLMILAAGVALALCIADAIIQVALYCRRTRPQPPPGPGGRGRTTPT